ncbi:MAG TPA: hypothetical protein VGH28_24995 [Polyangiaceae bacterium]|jgi:hypothetical protein
MRTLPVVFIVLSMGSLGAVAACSGGGDQGDGGTDATADGPTKKDSGVSDAAADVPVVCTADPTYSTVTDQTATYTPTPTDGGTDGGTDAAADDGSADAADDGSADAMTEAGADDGGVIGGPQDFYQYNGTLNANGDFLDLEVYAGYGVFTGGIHTGKFDLKGADLDYGTCGLCLLVVSNGQSDTYMATAGTVTITSFQGTFAGSISNATFTHVTVDPNSFESTPVGDGCNTAIPALNISAPVTQQ